MIIAANKRNLQFILFTGVFIFFLALSIITEKYYWAAISFLFLIPYWGWNNLNLIFSLLLITLPFSFEYQLSSEADTDLPDEFLMLFVAALFFLYYVYSPTIISKRIWRHPLMILLLCGMLWALVTVSLSTDPIISLKFFLAKCWYIGAFVLAPLIILQNKQTIKRSFIAFAIALFLAVSIILIRHAGYSFLFAKVNDAVFPFFRNHVNYSAMLVCSMPLFFAFYKLSESKKARRYISFAILILLIALIFSYSRGAWLALLVGSMAYWLIKKRILLFSFIIAIVISFGLLFWLKENNNYLRFSNDFKTTIYHKNFKEHLIATYKLKDVSTAERFYRWVAGVRMVKDKWLTGYGPSTFYYNYKPYAVSSFRTWVSNNKEHSTVHNYFLLITIEQGIPGLILLLLLIGSLLLYAQRLYHRVQDKFYKTIAATVGVILSMLIVVNFLSDLIETDKVGSIFFLCISMLIITDMNTRKESNSSADIQSIP